MKSAVTRFDDTLNAALHSSVPELVQLAVCIQSILNASSQTARERVKSSLGKDLSLGYHRADSPAIQQQRHLVRAALLVQIVLQLPTINRQTGNTLLALTTVNLQNHIQGLFNFANKASPVIFGDGVCSTAFNDVGRGGIKHELQYGSSSGDFKHLCYVPTREMVWVKSIRIGDVTHDNIAPYGDGANFNRILFAPWYPTSISATDSPASPKPNLSTLDHTIVDKHTHSTNMATGPMVGEVPVSEPIFMFKAPLIESELIQEQWYQYNDTGDSNTWNRQNIGFDGNIDPYWKNIPGGNFTLVRTLYQNISGVWRLRFRKLHGFNMICENEVDVIDHRGFPAR